MPLFYAQIFDLKVNFIKLIILLTICSLKLRNYGIKSEDIKLIDLIVADPMLRAIGEPLERKQNPRNAYESRTIERRDRVS